jgi:carboxyl-terminal processing protease
MVGRGAWERLTVIPSVLARRMIGSRRFAVVTALSLAVTGGPAHPIGGGPSRASAEELKPTETHRVITRGFLDIVQQRTVFGRVFDRDMAALALDAYLKTIDPDKQFFLQSDVAEFQEYKATLAAKVKSGDVSVAFDVYRRFQQRVGEAEVVWEQLLRPDAGFDFTVNESIVVDSAAKAYPKDAEDARSQWRLWFKYQVLMMKVDPDTKDFDLARAREDVAATYARYARGVRQIDANQVLGTFLTCVGGLYDPETTYTPPAEGPASKADPKGPSFGGIGIIWNENGEVESLIPGGPAADDGRLKPKDRIVSVGQGKAGALVDITRLTQHEAQALLRGEAGSAVRLGVRRAGEKQLEILVLTRGVVTPPEVRVQSSVESYEGLKIGTVVLPRLYRGEKDGEGSAGEIRKHLESFVKQAVNVVVLDLRHCQGGTALEAAALAGLFTGTGPVLELLPQRAAGQTIKNHTTPMVWNRPLVVLIGEGTY